MTAAEKTQRAAKAQGLSVAPMVDDIHRHENGSLIAGRWLVTCESDPALRHQVRFEGRPISQWSCSCQDWRRHREEDPYWVCKHILAVQGEPMPDQKNRVPRATARAQKERLVAISQEKAPIGFLAPEPPAVPLSPFAQRALEQMRAGTWTGQGTMAEVLPEDKSAETPSYRGVKFEIDHGGWSKGRVTYEVFEDGRIPDIVWAQRRKCPIRVFGMTDVQWEALGPSLQTGLTRVQEEPEAESSSPDPYSWTPEQIEANQAETKRLRLEAAALREETESFRRRFEDDQGAAATAPPTLASIHEALCQPFPIALVEVKPGAVGNGKALALAYVDMRAYQSRLDEVAGPDQWSVEYRPLGASAVICRLTILGVTREDVGEADPEGENAATCMIAQAFKRTCASFGLGRYLYSLPRVWTEYDPQRKALKDPEGTIQALYRGLKA